MSYVLANTNPEYAHLEAYLKEQLGDKLQVINSVDQLTDSNLREINPRYIFFPHWSHIVPKKIVTNFECVCFHMTDLPFGRGGSPLQNLIVRNFKSTKLSVLRMDEGIDTGDIYLKEELSLEGTAKEIFVRCGHLMKDIILRIINEKPEPQKQIGEIVNFKRRKPEDGNLRHLESISAVYDYIRMLDSENYPNAFIEIDNFRIEFNNATLDNETLKANVRIIKK